MNANAVRKQNKEMNSLDSYFAFNQNFYALLISIVSNKSAKSSLRDMGLLFE